jgi:outer membrane protein assembly factor BamB
VTSSPAVAGGTVYVSPLEGRVVAVSARTGAIRWSTVLDTHGLTTLHSSPVVSGHRLIVGVASAENVLSPGPYDFRGSVAALDTRTGRILWQTYVMPADLDGRGGSVWGTAAIDERRGIAYIGTGQGSSRPVGPLTDALLALRLRDGSLAWQRQFTRDDVWNAFGELAGKDYDLGASPNLFRIRGRDVVGVGDKGGRYATLDRKTGATVWRRRLCAGSHLGGIMTTAAVARGSIWVACNKPSAAALDTATADNKAPYFDWPLHKPPSYSAIFRLSAATGRTVAAARAGRDVRGADRGGRRGLRAQHQWHLPGLQRAERPRPLEGAAGCADRGRSHRGGREGPDGLRRPVRRPRAGSASPPHSRGGLVAYAVRR